MPPAVFVDFKDLRVLLLEDEQFMRDLIGRLLAELDVGVVVTATDGEDGYRKLKRARRPFHLVICDLEMPNVNGFQFLRRLRTSTEVVTPDVPVLVLTGHSDESTLHKVVELGVQGFLAKPVSKATLEERIRAATVAPEIDPTVLG